MPIKRSEHIIQLSREHHFSLLFAWKIRQAVSKQVDPSRIKKYIEYFKTQHLFPHFKDEEDILFVLQPDNPGVKKAIQEHVQIKDFLQKVSLLEDTDENASGILLDLAQRVDDHVRYEERFLFPELEKSLTASQLESVGHVLNHDILQKPVDDYADEFWIQKK